MSYTLQWPERGAYKKFSGIVTMPELLESLSKVQCHFDYDRLAYSITDFLDVEEFSLNESDVMLYGAQVIGGQFTNPRLLVAILVTDPVIIKFLKSRYEPLTRYTVAYFPTLLECAKWIELKTGLPVTFRAQ
jgi:hypothetical protein